MQVTCDDCKSVLEIEEADLRVVFHGGDAWERGTRCVGFKCPLCERLQKIDRLPAYILRAVDKVFDRDGKRIST